LGGVSIPWTLVRRPHEARNRPGATTETEKETAMKFMVLVKANADSEAGVMPSESELVEMGKFNEELVKAGILLAAEGLQASS
jgi:hypothetical protein